MTEMYVSSGPAASSTTEPEVAQRRRLLLVEGDGFTRLVLLLRLRLAGFGVDFTSNGLLGLGKLRSCHPDILLVELKLFGLSGLDLIKAARAEPAFGQRPIYVFTQANRISRTARKEVELLGVTLFDKNTTTREDLVQILETTFLKRPGAKYSKQSASAAPVQELTKKVVTGAIRELVAGVRELCELFVGEEGTREETRDELLSRVSSLESCAEATGLPNVARQAKALENLLRQLRNTASQWPDTVLPTVTRAVEVMNRLSLESNGEEKTSKRFTAVVVDEAPASSRATRQALEEAGFVPTCFELPTNARDYLGANRTDLIIANIALPEAHGLALSDIRQLLLHKETPVIFGPESNLRTPVDDDLPVSAARLDRAPVLAAELIVRALNEVQSAGLAEPATPVALPAPRAAGNAVRTKTALGDFPFEDGVDLFAQVPRAKKTPAPQSAPSSEEDSGEALFNAGTFAGFRVEPGSPGEDHELAMLEAFPVTPIDPSQAEEHPMESFTPSGVQAEAPPEIVPESTGEAETARPQWEAEPVAPEDVSVPAAASVEGFEPETTVPSDLPSELTNTYEEIMNNQFRVSRADFVHHADVPLAGLSGRAAAPEDPMAEQNAQARCAELEQEIAALRQAFEGLNGGLGEAPGGVVAADHRVQELEQQLSQSAAELEQHKQEHGKAESDLRHQLEAAQAQNQQSEAARQQADGRCAQLEKELEQARRENEEKSRQLATQLNGAAEPTASDPEQQEREQVAALARATAELAIERGERQRNQQRAAELSGRLQTLHQDLSRTLESQRQDLTRIAALEEQQRQTSQALERSMADVEQHKADLRLAEAELDKAREQNVQLRKDLSFFEETNKDVDGSRQQLQARLEASLKTARETEARLQQESAERQRLEESLAETQRELQNQIRRHDALAQELQSTQETLQEREAKLQKQAADRQQDAHDPARDVRESSERALEFSKIKSALQLEQVERKKQESELARTRQSALDAAHAARALRATMRRQIREPVDNVIQSARNLLELEMGDEQKKLAQALLEESLLVQARLREPAVTQADSSDTTITHK